MKSWNEKKKYLVKLIKNVSELYGGDEKPFLWEYIKQIVNENLNQIDLAIVCFESLEKLAPRRLCKKQGEEEEQTYWWVCKKCNYRPLFCVCDSILV